MCSTHFYAWCQSAFCLLKVSDEPCHLSLQGLSYPSAYVPRLPWNCTSWLASAKRIHKHLLSLPPLGFFCWREMFHISHWPLLHKTARICPIKCQCYFDLLSQRKTHQRCQRPHHLFMPTKQKCDILETLCPSFLQLHNCSTVFWISVKPPLCLWHEHLTC